MGVLHFCPLGFIGYSLKEEGDFWLFVVRAKSFDGDKGCLNPEPETLTPLGSVTSTVPASQRALARTSNPRLGECEC